MNKKILIVSLSMMISFSVLAKVTVNDVNRYSVHLNASVQDTPSNTIANQWWNMNRAPNENSSSSSLYLYGGSYRHYNGRCVENNFFTGACSCPSGYTGASQETWGGNTLYFCEKWG
ncbi:hypothetical protein [Photobacterium aquae]|uniref:hypothetical protein n=1 Tax=Photobacterium aquae TaxID=1195763 RepID=UPI0012EDF38C|nr:hypothetical protein [Photobacterium aquae]